MLTEQHQPVLLTEVIQHLDIKPHGIYVDATFGRGGHASAILACLDQGGHLLALDRDPEAIAAGHELLGHDNRLQLVHTEFSHLTYLLQQRNWLGKVDGIIMDLGVSSPQIATASRGFSFTIDGPLDMRMNPQGSAPSAAQWLATASVSEIAQVLRNLGEEHKALRIAKAIVTARLQQPLQTTKQLANIIAKANPSCGYGGRGCGCVPHSSKWGREGTALHKQAGKHPATRSFMAIRSYINEELTELTHGLQAAMEALAAGGRLLVISFHSLEDRIVKRFFRQAQHGDNFPAKLPILASATIPKLHTVIPPLRPSAVEIAANPRARSAILRVAVKPCYCGEQHPNVSL